MRGNRLQVSRAVTDQLHKKTADKLRSWRVSIIRKHGRYLGTVDAANEKAAEAAAVAQFNLSDEQRKGLIVRERV